MITQRERQELRGVVRGQFKVLREEVLARKTEMMAAVDGEIAAKYSEQDAAWAGVMHTAGEAERDANRRINDALYEAGYQTRGHSEHQWVRVDPTLAQPTRDRHVLRQQASGRIDTQVKAALLRLSREEQDLLRELAVDALESEQARTFLSRIPSVGELVPGTRLAELERSYGDG